MTSPLRCYPTLKPCPNISVEGVREEGFKVYSPFNTVIKSQTDAEVSNLFSSNNVDGGGHQLSFLVMFQSILGVRFKTQERP